MMNKGLPHTYLRHAHIRLVLNLHNVVQIELANVDVIICQWEYFGRCCVYILD